MLEILKDELLYGLNAVSRFVNPKSTLPTLGTVLLNADENGLSLTATDLQSTVHLKLGAVVDESFAICISPNQLLGLLSPRSETKVQLSYNDSGLELKVKAGRMNTKIKGYDLQEFPLVPGRMTDNLLTVDTEELVHALESVIPFAAQDQKRPSLNGVNFVFGENELKFLTTNGYSMAKQIIQSDNLNISSIVYLDALVKTMALLRQLKPDTVELSFVDKRQMMVAGDRCYVINHVCTDSFPDVSSFESGWQGKSSSQFVIDSNLLSMVLRSSGQYTKDSNQMLVEANADQVVFFAESGELGEFKDVQDCVSSGSFSSVLNVESLGVISKLVNGNIVIETKGVKQPIYVYEQGNQQNFWVVMPFHN